MKCGNSARILIKSNHETGPDSLLDNKSILYS